MFGRKKIFVDGSKRSTRKLQKLLDEGWYVVRQTRPLFSPTTDVFLKRGTPKGNPPPFIMK